MAALVLGGLAAQGAQAAPLPATSTVTGRPPKAVTVTVRKPIPYAVRTVRDGSLAVGVMRVRTLGVAGIRT